MENILFGILLGVMLTCIARLIVIYFKKLQVIIKNNRENRKYYYGLSKSKRIMLDEVISTYEYVMKDLQAIYDEDKSSQKLLRDVTGTLQNRIMNVASTIGGDGGSCYVRNKTGITYYKPVNK